MTEPTAPTLGEWLKSIQGFRAGGVGYAVVAVTLVATAFLAFNPQLFLPPGRYPKIVMMVPPLLAGGAIYLALGVITWLPRRARR